MASNNKPIGAAFSPSATPKYLNDFSKALASEVRILLQEVGKLRDERRALQHEIAELMAVKAKHSAGGEYSPDWRPKYLPEELMPHDPAPPPPPPEEPPAPEGPARPAWRTVIKRPEPSAGGRRKGKAAAAAAPPPAPPPPPPAIEAPRPELPSWAQWRPNPNVHPVVRGPTPSQAVMQAPPRQGLFGTCSPLFSKFHLCSRVYAGPVTPPPS
ncbi:hypothetical protein B0F90DRAFT_1701450 [Multifurca ochricompacta]|uniref:Uncharacterized protein n=1 Tax=Multifurca ochricompacta TaxID=376703 RepID=A0AAD4M7X3_9AGAM|nr:hypothetical protein B0F90DRAFT_1701450 [Multifurca ochricompacta]